MKTLKLDIKNNNLKNLYIFWGDENYLKKHYEGVIKSKILDENFIDFNELILNNETFNIENIYEFINSYPVMSDKKLLILKDIDIFTLKDIDIFLNTPDYIHILIIYSTIEYKPDKRTSVYKNFIPKVSVIEFPFYKDIDLIPWIKRRADALNACIDTKECEYLIFNCGSSMVNLINEIEKLCAYSKKISKADIDNVCTKILSAVIFDISDLITLGEFDKAINLSNILMNLKNEPILILASFTRHLEKLYVISLAKNKGDTYLMNALNTKSSFYLRKMLTQANKLSIGFLSESVVLCMYADRDMKTLSNANSNILTDLLLKMAVVYGKN